VAFGVDLVASVSASESDRLTVSPDPTVRPRPRSAPTHGRHWTSMFRSRRWPPAAPDTEWRQQHMSGARTLPHGRPTTLPDGRTPCLAQNAGPHLSGRPLAGFGGPVDVAGPPGRGLGAGEMDRPDRLAQCRTEPGQSAGLRERAVAATAELLGAPILFQVVHGVVGPRAEIGREVVEDELAALAGVQVRGRLGVPALQKPKEYGRGTAVWRVVV